MPRVVPRCEVRHLVALGAGRGAGRVRRQLVRAPDVCAGDAGVRAPRPDLRPPVEVRLQGRHRAVEGGEVRPGPPDGPLREGGGEVLRQHGRAPRQLRPVELEAPGVERGQPRPEEGHRRALAGRGAQARAALRRQRAFRAQLQLDAAQPRQRHQRAHGRRAVRRRRSEVRPPVRPAARRHERGLSHQSARDLDAGVVRPHAGPGRIRTSRTWSIRTAAFPSARSAAASWRTSTTGT